MIHTYRVHFTFAGGTTHGGRTTGHGDGVALVHLDHPATDADRQAIAAKLTRERADGATVTVVAIEAADEPGGVS